MEELQSTEVLDREILEDARKKALRLLKTADDTIAAGTAEWDKKTSVNIKELEAKFDIQKKQDFERVMARLPIDKLRAKIEYIENLLLDAVETWYKSLKRERVLELITEELSKRIKLCEEIFSCKNKNVYYSALERSEAEAVLKTACRGKESVCSIEPAFSAGDYPSIVFKSENISITASIQNIIDYYLLEKREELVTALVGSDFAGSL